MRIENAAARTIAYGPAARQYVRLVPARGSAPRAAVVWVHGGFWRAEKDADSMVALCADLAEHGLAGASVEYRTVEFGGRWPVCAEDVVAAVTAFWATGTVAPEHTVLAGHSAGGQLALLAAHRLPGLGAVAALAAVSDLVAADRARLGADAVRGLCQDRASVRAASPLHGAPPPCRVLVVHGDADQAVPVDQSRRYARFTEDAGVPTRLVVVPDARHLHLVKPERPAWAVVRAELLALTRDLADAT